VFTAVLLTPVDGLMANPQCLANVPDVRSDVPGPHADLSSKRLRGSDRLGPESRKPEVPGQGGKAKRQVPHWKDLNVLRKIHQ
jgi:hypothetical protein